MIHILLSVSTHGSLINTQFSSYFISDLIGGRDWNTPKQGINKILSWWCDCLVY